MVIYLITFGYYGQPGDDWGIEGACLTRQIAEHRLKQLTQDNPHRDYDEIKEMQVTEE